MKELLVAGVLTVVLSTGVYASDCVDKGGCPLSDIPSCMKIKPCANLEFQCSKKDADITCPLGVKRYQKFVTGVKRERATICNALDLTEEQSKKYDELVNNYAPKYDEMFEKLMKESFKVKALKEAGAGEREINRQKKVVKNIKKDIEDVLAKEDKEFKKYLTREQRSKYSMIKKLERKDYKSSCHKKDYYKSNPKMRPFGNPKK